MCSRTQYADLTYMGGTGPFGPIQPIFNTNLCPVANRSLFAKFEVRHSLRSDTIVITTVGRTDGQTDIAQMSQNLVSRQILYCIVLFFHKMLKKFGVSFKMQTEGIFSHRINVYCIILNIIFTSWHKELMPLSANGHISLALTVNSKKRLTHIDKSQTLH